MQATISKKARKFLSNPDYAKAITGAILKQGNTYQPIIVKLNDKESVELTLVGKN